MSQQNNNNNSGGDRKRTYEDLFVKGRAPRKMLPEKQRRYHHQINKNVVRETGTQYYGSQSDAQTQTESSTTSTQTQTTSRKVSVAVQTAYEDPNEDYYGDVSDIE